jgi:hypothetical protein
MVTKKKLEEPLIRPDCRTRRGLELIADQFQEEIMALVQQRADAL